MSRFIVAFGSLLIIASVLPPSSAAPSAHPDKIIVEPTRTSGDKIIVEPTAAERGAPNRRAPGTVRSLAGDPVLTTR